MTEFHHIQINKSLPIILNGDAKAQFEKIFLPHTHIIFLEFKSIQEFPPKIHQHTPARMRKDTPQYYSIQRRSILFCMSRN